MLYSKFHIGDDCYVIEINKIIEIVPFVNLKSIPSLPDYAAGLLSYRGISVPVIDLCQLLISRSCKKRLSTRVIVTSIRNDGGEDITIGFLVEHATETTVVQVEEFIDPGMSDPEMPYVGMVANADEGMITKIIPQDIFAKLDKELFVSECLDVMG